MIILITGASHTGKTVLAQKLLEKYQYPYLSIDILKMGLIRCRKQVVMMQTAPEAEYFVCCMSKQEKNVTGEWLAVLKAFGKKPKGVGIL